MAAITLELLEILDAIDRRGSFAAAAEELGRVPSALSYTIQKHEESLGLSLFVRQGRKSVFTPAGRLLLEEGRQLLQAADVVTAEVRTLASGWEPRLKIAVDSLLPVTRIMAVLAQFLQQHPGMEIDLCEEVLGGTWEALLDDRVQLVIGAPEPKPRGHGVRSEPLGVLDRVFAVAPNHPLAQRRGPLSQEEIAGHRLVIVHDSSRTSVPRTIRLLNEDKHFYVQSIAHKIAAQEAGIGVGFLPRRSISDALAAGRLVALDVDGVDLEDRLLMAWKVSNRGQGLKRLVRMLLDADILDCAGDS